MDMKLGTSGYGTLPSQMQNTDATICSNDSNYALNSSIANNASKQEGKIKAYVDFTEFNKNYEEYTEKMGTLNNKMPCDDGGIELAIG